MLDPVEVVTGEDWLGFGGVKPPSFPMISAAQQFAEKVHAYTLPRPNRMNTRTKDLVDMVISIRAQKLDAEKTAAAIHATFAKRRTHGIPKALASPPRDREPVFNELAKACHLNLTLQEAFATVQEFTGKLAL